MTHSAAVGLSKLENASLTAELTKSLHSWTYDEKSPALGSFGARTIGFIATPLTSVIDAIVHAFLFVGTATTGLFISSYNFIARQIDAKYLAPEDLELSSSLVHLSRVIESLFNAAILPFVMLLDPERGYQLSQESAGGNFATILEKYTATVAKLDKKKTMLEKLEEELTLQKTEKHQQKVLIGELQQEIQELKDQAQKYQEQYKDALIKGEKTASELSESLVAQGKAKDALAANIAKLEDELKTKEKELEDALLGKVNDASLIADKAGLQKEIAVLKEQLAAAQEKITKDAAAFEQAKLVLETAKAKLESDLTETKKVNESLKMNLQATEDIAQKHFDEKVALQAKVQELTDSHAKAVAELKEAKEKAQAQSFAKEVEIDHLKAKEAELQEQVEELTDVHAKTAAELKEVSEKVKEYSSASAAEIAAVKKEEAALQEKVKELTELCGKAKEELEDAQHKLASEKASKGEAEKLHQAAVATLDAQVKALEKELAAANEKAQKATEKQAAAKAKVEAQALESISQLEDELEARAKELEESNAAFAKLQAESDAKSEQLAKAAEEQALTKENVEKLLGAIGKLKAEKQEAMEQFSAIDAKFNELKLEQQAWLEAKAKLETETAALKEQIALKEKAIEESNNQRQLLVKSLQEAKETLEGIVGENTEMIDALAKSKEANQKLQQLYDEVSGELVASKEELAELKAQLEVKQTEIAALEEEAEKLVLANEALEEQLQAAQETVTALEGKAAASAIAEGPKATVAPAKLVPEETEEVVSVADVDSASGSTDKPLSPFKEEKLKEIEIDLDSILGNPALESAWKAHLQETTFGNHANFVSELERIRTWIKTANKLTHKQNKKTHAELKKVILDFASK